MYRLSSYLLDKLLNLSVKFLCAKCKYNFGLLTVSIELKTVELSRLNRGRRSCIPCSWIGGVVGRICVGKVQIVKVSSVEQCLYSLQIVKKVQSVK